MSKLLISSLSWNSDKFDHDRITLQVYELADKSYELMASRRSIGGQPQDSTTPFKSFHALYRYVKKDHSESIADLLIDGFLTLASGK